MLPNAKTKRGSLTYGCTVTLQLMSEIYQAHLQNRKESKNLKENSKL